jgi:leucine-rich repeat-containing protein 49
LWTVKDSRSTAATPSLLSRGKRQSPHELLNSVIGDHIIFSESPTSPGVPIVLRPPEERMKNPERLNLDRRNLSVCPILEGEDRLRLLNLQHNNIRKIENISFFRHLVFLDLYDNQIQHIGGISELVSLRVLMLGKNRIVRISGLETLQRLDVLDLHGNQISDMSGLENLGHLRVLNLAGNCITVVSGLSDLSALTELNLRRNRVTQVLEVDQLPCLQRLFLSHNLIQEWKDVQCIGNSTSIAELSLDNNPFSTSEEPYRIFVLSQMQRLHHLDMIPISDDERIALAEIRRSVEEERKEKAHMVRLQERRQSTILRIQRQWERLHGDCIALSASSASLRDFRDPDPNMPQTRSQSFCDVLSASSSSIASLMHSELRPTSQRSTIPASPMSYTEVVNGVLHLYGPRAVEVLETSSFGCPSETVKGLSFHFVDFTKIAHYLQGISVVLPCVKNLEFHCCSMSTYVEVNALAVLPVLHKLTITEEGNPLTRLVHWRTYAIYRLSHLQLTQLNNQEVTTEDLITSEQVFGGLGRICSLLPHSRLLDFVRGQRSAKKLSSKKRPVNQEPLSRSPLIYSSVSPNVVGLSKGSGSVRVTEVCDTPEISFGSKVVSTVVESAVSTNARLTAFEEIWLETFEEFVDECREEMKDLNVFMRKRIRDMYYTL